MVDGILSERDGPTGDGRVLRLTIDRPERRNALTWEAVSRLRAELAAAAADDTVRAVVLAGAGGRAFCSGIDLDQMLGDGDRGVIDVKRREFAGLMQDLWSLPVPTVAEVRGFAYAAGMGLALSCDFVYCSSSARFATPEINVGLWPFMITVPLLRCLPMRVVLEMMMTGRVVDANELLQWGAVNNVMPDEDLSSVVRECMDKLCDKAPSAMRLGKKSFYESMDATTSDALDELHARLGVLAETQDAEEGIAAFREKRLPQFGETNWPTK